MSKVRTRFAPSPTGFLHVGGVRTALFAWLVARQAGGDFILRIEDTDKSREVAESEKHITESLKWLGLEWDEGPVRQSGRLDLYKQWGQKLIDSGRAYADPYSPPELDGLRQTANAQKKPFLFRDHRPANPPQWDGSQPLRFKSEPRAYKWRDEVLGELSTGPEVVDDFILIKSDGYPTYNFAHVVDDHLMAISHVIRSQEFLASVPKFLNLYEALGFDQPKLATLPYVLGPDGKKKLSKRDGAKDILDYRREGYLPAALINFLATLGWNDGTKQEIFSVKELIKKFSLERVHRGGARFDEERLNWMNGHYIRGLAERELDQLAKDFWPDGSQDADLRHRVLEVSKDRLKKLSDLPTLSSYFFQPARSVAERADGVAELFRKQSADIPPIQWLSRISELISSSQITGPQSLEQPLRERVTAAGGSGGALFGGLRIALTGADQTPAVWEIIYALGKDESKKRLEEVSTALEK